MKRTAETIFVCSSCGNEFNKWQGQCSACGEWNTLKENRKALLGLGKGRPRGSPVQKIEVVNLGSTVQTLKAKSSVIFSTEIGEFDRVLGKGIVRGSVVLFAGEPGIGKSTLLTQLIGKIGGLYVAGEESAEQIKGRVERLGSTGQNIDVLETNDIESVIDCLDRTKDLYKIVVVDSIQMMATQNPPAGRAGVASPIGSVNQIKECTFRLIEAAKRLGVAIFIVGHVTKEGDIAGPKILEHMVDTVLYFEGEKNGDLRILRSTKNRFGPTDEVGIFRMEEKGLMDVREPAFTEASAGKVGSAITMSLEGTRPMMVEIQALVTESFAPVPKRVFSGIDFNRGQLLTAVAQKVLGIPLYKCDVYVAVTGGIRIEDTGADLAVVAAMYSSYKNKPFNFQFSKSNEFLNDSTFKTKNKSGFVFIGEVSLLGEVKKVKGWERRVKEAESLGGKAAIIYSIGELKRMI